MCYSAQIFELLTEFKKRYKVIPMYKTLLNSCDSSIVKVYLYISSIYTVYLEKEYENSRLLFQQYCLKTV